MISFAIIISDERCRRHIVKVIEDTGKCPFTGISLSTDDLISVVGESMLWMCCVRLFISTRQ